MGLNPFLAEFTRIFLFFFQDRGQIFDQVFGRFWGGLGGVSAGFWKVVRGIFPEISPEHFQENSGKTNGT